MNRKHLRVRATGTSVIRPAHRFVSHIPMALILGITALMLLTSSATTSFTSLHSGNTITVHAAARGNPWINLKDGQEVPTVYAGDGRLQAVMKQGQITATALASADLDEDGVPDLISGYMGPSGGAITLHRGNVDSVFPTPASAHDPSPFHPDARVFGLPQSPDFLGAGDFDGDGHQDVVAAARGGQALIWLSGDGRGGFDKIEQIPLAGYITALTSGEINRADGLSDLVVAVSGGDEPQVLVFESPEGALMREPEAFLMPAEATALALGHLDESYEYDLVVGAGTEVVIVHGRDRRLSLDEIRRAEVAEAVVDQLSLGFTIASVAIGDFIWDRVHRPELALLSDKGEVHLLARGQLDRRPWTDRQLKARKQMLRDEARATIQMTAAASALVAGAPGERADWEITDTVTLLTVEDSDYSSLSVRPSSFQLVTTRTSSLPVDTLVVIDGARPELQLVADHSSRFWKTTSSSKAVRPEASILSTLDAGEAPVAVLPMQLNGDALSDLVVLRKGSISPSVLVTAAMATFTVNSTAFTDDGTCDSSTPGGCTLEEAVNATNANPGADAINFDLGPGVPSITITDGMTLNQPVVIDGSAGPGGATRVEINGNNSPGAVFEVLGGSSTLRALVINRGRREGIFMHVHNGNKIEGNFIGTDATGTLDRGNAEQGVTIDFSSAFNTIGGTAPGASNVISGNNETGVLIFGSGNLLQGNHIGTDVAGAADLGNSFEGVFIFADTHGVGANNNTIGGTAAGAGNVISGNGAGVTIDNSNDFGTTGNKVQGNFIGTDASGTVALGNTGFGVFGSGVSLKSGAANNTIGGTTPAARNLISGHNHNGVAIRDSGSTGNLVQGNFIGTDVTGAANLGNLEHGVLIAGPFDNRIGGTGIDDGNTIAFNGGDGVFVNSGSGNAILRNSIFSNAGLGIDLSPNGVTGNDTGDGDGGANNRQNFPVMATVVQTDASTVQITGTLNSTADRMFRIEIFLNPSCDREGKDFFSAFTVTTDASGNASFMQPALFDAARPFYTLTATDLTTNDTSEFSACAQACGGITCPGDITTGTGPGNSQCGKNVTFSPTVTGTCGEVTCTPPSGSFFVVGATTVTCTTESGSTCEFAVTVNDTTPPQITCPADQTLLADAGCQAVATFSASATDNCTESPAVTCTPPSGSAFNLGTTNVTCMATDTSGNTSSCTFTVTLNDTQPPSITCPANISRNNDPNQCGAVVSYPVPTVSDNCPGATVGCSPASGSFFPVATTTVTCTATDSGGNTAQCSFTVTVNDTQPPAITCQANVTAVAAPTCPPSTGAAVTFPPPAASDNCPGVTAICSPASGSAFPVGTTTVTCTATDAAGNTASCTFTVTVFNGCVQDDSNPNTVALFMTSGPEKGKYRFCCGGTTYTGIGNVSLRGCTFTLEHNPADRRVRIKVHFAVSKGTASIKSPPGTIKCTITDRNITNNTCACAGGN